MTSEHPLFWKVKQFTYSIYLLRACWVYIQFLGVDPTIGKDELLPVSSCNARGNPEMGKRQLSIEVT